MVVRNLEQLIPFLPQTAFIYIKNLLQQYDVRLSIVKKRVGKLGDYRAPFRANKYHKITINEDLNEYSFLITLIHEIAHMVTFVNYGRNVKSHGEEWKRTYASMLIPLIGQSVFPIELEEVLSNHFINPSASSCRDVNLSKALKKYDKIIDDKVYLESLEENRLFSIHNGRTFKKGKVVRKRIKCQDVHNNRLYLFSPIAEVKPM